MTTYKENKNNIAATIRLDDAEFTTTTTFWIDQGLWLKIRSLALVKGMSAAELVRRAVCEKHNIGPTLREFKKVAGKRGVSKMIRDAVNTSFFH